MAGALASAALTSNGLDSVPPGLDGSSRAARGGGSVAHEAARIAGLASANNISRTCTALDREHKVIGLSSGSKLVAECTRTRSRLGSTDHDALRSERPVTQISNERVSRQRETGEAIGGSPSATTLTTRGNRNAIAT